MIKSVLLVQTKLNTIEGLIFSALVGSYISQDECVLVNNVLKEVKDMKCVKRMSWYERRNKTFKDFDSSSKTLIYL